MMRISFLTVIVFASVAAQSHAAVLRADVHCAATAEAAVERWLGHTVDGDDVEGYRVIRIQQDTVRNHRWAVVQRCGHPEMPMQTMRLAPGIEPTTPALDGVRLGDSIRIVQHSNGSRIELNGVALDAGSPGEAIRVRFGAISTEPDGQFIELRCRILAKGLVEVWQ